MPDWRVSVLTGLGAPTSSDNMNFLATWQRYEGGHTNNDARWNWLNTTRNGAGAMGSINSVGVKKFDSYANGIRATLDTLKQSQYIGIVQGLLSGKPQGDSATRAGLSTWLSGKPDSAAGQKYAAKVLGAPGAAPPLSRSDQDAAQAWQAGPAAIVAGPSPQDELRMRQQAAATLIQLGQDVVRGGDTSAFMKAFQAIGQARIDLRDATAKANQSDASVAAYDGSTSDPGPTVGAPTRQIASAIEIAKKQVGKPYVWGAESPKEGGFDCSGLIDYSFKQAGIKLPGRLTTSSAMRLGQSVRGQPMKPGDWIITKGGGHMVMYVGNGQVIAAPRRGEVVQYQPLSRFASNTMDVRRLVGK